MQHLATRDLYIESDNETAVEDDSDGVKVPGIRVEEDKDLRDKSTVQEAVAHKSVGYTSDTPVGVDDGLNSERSAQCAAVSLQMISTTRAFRGTSVRMDGDDGIEIFVESAV